MATTDHDGNEGLTHEPQTRGDQVRDKGGEIWTRSNRGVWRWDNRPHQGLGKLHWETLVSMYGPLQVVKQKGVTQWP